MNATIIVSLLYVLIVLVIVAGIAMLQIFLSKRQSKWPGLILPGICLAFSIFAVLGMAVFTNVTEHSVQTISENGKVVNEIISRVQDKNNKDLGSAIFSALMMFITCNIPTVSLLAIYAACREKRSKKSELEKMNIQDLD